MKVRVPEFNFSGTSPAWGDNPEHCAVINAGSIIPPPIERYVLKIVRDAKAELDPVLDMDLLDQIDIFTKQEGQHLKLHADYVRMLEQRYPRIREFEFAFAAELDTFIDSKSLEWNLGYCEGFEANGTAMAESWLDGDIEALCGDHGSVPMQLWMWHVAEEFEHRSVVHRLLRRLVGDERAHQLRCEGIEANQSHITLHTVAASRYIFEVERMNMTLSEISRSVVREERAWLDFSEKFRDKISWAYAPDYDPELIPAPTNYQRLLDMYT